VQVGTAIPAPVCHLDLILYDLDLGRTIVAARDQVETCFHPTA
jgi:hypothetical protein